MIPYIRRHKSLLKGRKWRKRLVRRCKRKDGEEISQQQPEQGTTRSTDIVSTNANENRGQQHATWTTTAGGKDEGRGSNDGFLPDSSTN